MQGQVAEKTLCKKRLLKLSKIATAERKCLNENRAASEFWHRFCLFRSPVGGITECTQGTDCSASRNKKASVGVK